MYGGNDASVSVGVSRMIDTRNFDSRIERIV